MAVSTLLADSGRAAAQIAHLDDARLLGWRDIPAAEARVTPGNPSNEQYRVRDSWPSRYQEEILFASGAYLRFEEMRYPYAAGLPPQQVFYQIFGDDPVLRKSGMVRTMSSVSVGESGGRSVAYLLSQSAGTTCFSFVSQYAATSGALPRFMVSGQDCAAGSAASADQMRDKWFAILSGLQIK